MNKTIIYVSANRENPEFEEKLRQDLLSKTDLPIVSVTQKPIDFGHNICVGDVGTSGFNFCRQVMIACENAKTDYVISAESDCLYSPDYFKFEPKELDIAYRNTNTYVQKYGADYVCKKNEGGTWSQIIGREFYIKRFKSLFLDQPMWSTEYKNFPKEIGQKLLNRFEKFETEYACISFKTGKGMRKHSHSTEIPVYELPYWGSIKDLRIKYEAN